MSSVYIELGIGLVLAFLLLSLLVSGQAGRAHAACRAS